MYGIEDALLYHFYFKALPLLFLNLVFLSQNIGLVVVKHLLKPIVLTTHDETVPTFIVYVGQFTHIFSSTEAVCSLRAYRKRRVRKGYKLCWHSL